MKILKYALAAVIVLVAPTLAQAKEAREPVKLELSAKGLDFSNPASIAAFYSKANRQIADFCNPADRYDAGNRIDRQCRAEMAANLSGMMRNLAMGPVAGKATQN
jgi:UrcA family protein